MSDKDKEAFDKWLEIEFGKEVDKSRAFLYEKSIFRFACDYMQAELAHHIFKIEAENKKLRYAHVTNKYIDSGKVAREALKEVGE